MAIISQGSFISAGQTVYLPIRSDVDAINVYNITQMGDSQTTAVGVQYRWQRGFPAGAEIVYLKSNAANAANLIQYLTNEGGFTLIDTSVQVVGVLDNGSTGISAISTATPPVVTVGSTAGMAPNNVVRLYNTTGATQLGGLDYTIGNGTFTGTTFSLDYVSPLGGAGTGGNFSVIAWDPIYYPRRRYVMNVSQAAQAIVTLSVTHGYQVGQEVSFRIPSSFGMVQLDSLYGTIVAINQADANGYTNTITVDINTSMFTAFVFPATGLQPFTAAQCVPVGENTAFALSVWPPYDILTDATTNTAFIGIALAAGVIAPAGSADDVIYWEALKADQTGVLAAVPGQPMP